MSRRVSHVTIAITAALGVLLLTSGAAGDPLHLRTPAQCVTEGGSTVRLDPGYYLLESDWEALDASIRDTQNEVTRLRAENKSLRGSTAGNVLAWAIAGGAFVLGIEVGRRAF